MTLWKLFEATATRFAHCTAIEVQRASGLESWTYRELHDAAVASASALAAMGITAGDRCAILADNDASWCAAYLGILGAGGVAMPLDTNCSAAQVSTIVRDASVRVVFVNARLEDVARQAVQHTPGVAICSLAAAPWIVGTSGLKATAAEESSATTGRKRTPADATSRAIAGEQWPREKAGVEAPVARSSDTAVILYTSGTTADPKGVVLSHGNLIAGRDAVFAVIDVSEKDSVLGVLPLFHALAQLTSLLLPLLAGARVVFLETVNLTELARALAERRITIFACGPQRLSLIHQRLMTEPARTGSVRRALFAMRLALSFRLRRIGFNPGALLFRKAHRVMGRQMRLFVVGGSKVDAGISRDLYALGITVLQVYGLSETAGAATITSPDDAHVDAVGRALPGHEIRILSSSEPELEGEVAIRGPSVMQGYLNRPDATQAVLGDGWLLTGDLGRLDGQGRLTITGRKKETIVLATGKNIAPAEIEACYRKSPFVKEICVVGLSPDDESVNDCLYAVVVPDMELMRARRVVNAGDLIRFEMEGQSIHLPPHKRLRGYDVWFEPLPRTTTGQLKRYEVERRLRQKRRDATAASASRIPHEWTDDPHANAVAEVLARRAVGAIVRPASNLELDLGFDSIKRIEVLIELEHRFGIKVPDEAAHEVLTVEQLIEVFRPGGLAGPPFATEQTWATLLRDLPPTSDPVLSPLLERRPIIRPLFFTFLRLLSLVLPRVHATGVDRLPATGPYIITPNHQGYLDPFFVCSVLPYRIVAKLFFVGAAEYFESPITAWFARQCNLLPVDPDAHLVPAMKAGAFGLSHGKILVLFPEGERSIDGTVKRFKKGAPILSRHLDVPVVPVAIHGAFEIWPRNRALNWRLLLPWSGHRIRVTFGAPVTFEKSQADGEAAAQLRNTVHAMWETLDRSR